MKADSRKTRDEERIRQRTTQIIEAAARIFARKGFYNTTTKEIAAEAGIAEGTIYNYYGSKRDLLLAMFTKLASESLLEIMERADEMDARTLLTEILRDRLALLGANHEIAFVVIHELMIDADLRERFFAEVVAPFAQQVMGHFARKIATGDFRAFDPRIILPAIIGATFMSGLVTTGGINVLAPGVAFPSREEVIAELVEFLLHGIERGERPKAPQKVMIE